MRAEVGTRLEISKYEMKLGAEDKSKNGVHIFSLSQYEARNQSILPCVFSNLNDTGPAKKEGM